jgi:hypothetical protein
VDVLKDFRDWMRRHPGGGYPKKVDQMIAQVCQERGVPKPDYVQAEGGDLEVLKAACKGGRLPGVTYSFSPTGRYGGARISHMVSLPHADDRWFVVLDNNYPGTRDHEDTYEWLSPQEFQKTYAGGGGGWCVVLLSPCPRRPHTGERSKNEATLPAVRPGLRGRAGRLCRSRECPVRRGVLRRRLPRGAGVPSAAGPGRCRRPGGLGVALLPRQRGVRPVPPLPPEERGDAVNVSPEVLHLVFTLLGAALGWYVRHSSLGVSPEVLGALQALLSRQKQQQAHGLLQDLLAQVPAPPPRA